MNKIKVLILCAVNFTHQVYPVNDANLNIYVMQHARVIMLHFASRKQNEKTPYKLKAMEATMNPVSLLEQTVQDVRNINPALDKPNKRQMRLIKQLEKIIVHRRKCHE